MQNELPIPLANQRVLFIGPVFFGYETEIIKALRAIGAEVDFLPDRPFTSSIMKALTRFQRNLVVPHMNKQFRQRITEFGRSHYDYVFVVQGEGLSTTLLREMRTSFPGARFVWYLWDSLRNKRALVPNLSAFDQCFTFDRDDSRAYGMGYRPLFYLNEFGTVQQETPRFHLSFVGTAHSDRYKVVASIERSLPDSVNFYRYLYLQAPWVYWAHKTANPAFRGAKQRDFSFLPLKKDEVRQIFSDSLAVLDIEHPKQTGLTMRTFETLGARKKLVTTNRSVVDEDFYDPNNVLVVERGRPLTVPPAFFDSPYVDLASEIYRRYSIDAWLAEILNVDVSRTS